MKLVIRTTFDLAKLIIKYKNPKFPNITMLLWLNYNNILFFSILCLEYLYYYGYFCNVNPLKYG